MNVKAFGVVNCDSKIMIHCRDGELFEIRANNNEMLVLLDEISKSSQDLMVGYIPEHQRQYAHIVRDFKTNLKR